MDFKLYNKLKNKISVGKSYRENWNYETRIYSKGYSKAMWEIDEILDSFIKEYEKSA